MIVGIDIALLALVAATVAFWFGCFITSYRTAVPADVAIARQNLMRLLRTATVTIFSIVFFGAAG